MKMTKRQAQIIDLAINLIAEKGIKNLTIKNLADQLGVTEPAIYRHFSSKAEIVRSVIKSFTAETSFDLGKNDGIDYGLNGIELFIRSRFYMVIANPALSKVVFSEEIFMETHEYSGLVLDMMHSHRDNLKAMLKNAQAAGEVRTDISIDMIFRLIMGPVRLLVKQWGMSGQSFDLLEKGEEMLDALRKTLKPVKA